MAQSRDGVTPWWALFRDSTIAFLVPLAIWLLVDGAEDNIWAALQSAAVVATGVVIFRYTLETQRLRVLGEAQQDLARRQQETAVEALALQREAMAAAHRPMIVAVFAEMAVCLTNIGTGPALNVFARFRDQFSSYVMPEVNLIQSGESVWASFVDQAPEGTGANAGSEMLMWSVMNSAGDSTPYPELEIDCIDLAGTKFRSLLMATRLGAMYLIRYGASPHARPAGEYYRQRLASEPPRDA